MKFLVKNAKIVTGETIQNGIKEDVFETVDILVENGKFSQIKKNISSLDTETFDAQGMLIIPGVVDPHVHMRDPGLTYKEDFYTGTKAAIKGGVTTIIDMPNTIPLTSTEEALNSKFANSQGRAFCDYGFHFGGVKSDNSSEIFKVTKRVASTKIFLNQSTGDMLIDEETTVKNLFNASKIISVHAEGEKVEEAIGMAKQYDKPLYLCHLSTEEELTMLEKAKSEGIKVFGEVTPHHLFLKDKDRDYSERNSHLLRMKPELKTENDCQALWKALDSGLLDTVGTDHAPHTKDEKFEKTVFGIPGVENSLEMMLKGVSQKKITLFRLTEVMCKNPCEIFNIQGKGQIKEGFDADFVIIDMDKISVISDNNVVSKCQWTPYHGMKNGGTITQVFLRGNSVYKNGEFSETPQGKEISYR